MTSGTPFRAILFGAVSCVPQLPHVGSLSEKLNASSELGDVGYRYWKPVFCLIFATRNSDGLTSVAFGKPAR